MEFQYGRKIVPSVLKDEDITVTDSYVSGGLISEVSPDNAAITVTEKKAI